jgi:hypothetical protein
MVHVNSQSPTHKISQPVWTKGNKMSYFTGPSDRRTDPNSPSKTVRVVVETSYRRLPSLLYVAILSAVIYIVFVIPLSYQYLHPNGNKDDLDATTATAMTSITTTASSLSALTTGRLLRQSPSSNTIQGSTHREDEAIHIVFSTGCTPNQDCTLIFLYHHTSDLVFELQTPTCTIVVSLCLFCYSLLPKRAIVRFILSAV